MKLTPLDIRKQEFKKSMRGYDPVEVNTFMEMAADEFEDALKQQKEMRDRVLELETQLKDYRQIEKTLQQTLMQAHEATGRSYETARREAESILREAETRGAKILEEATNKLNQTKEEIRKLAGKRDGLVARLRLLLSSELELLKTMEPDNTDGDPGFGTGKESVDLDAILNKVQDGAA